MSGGKKMMEVYERSVSIFHTEKTAGILKREEQLLNFKKRCLTKVENFKKV